MVRLQDDRANFGITRGIYMLSSGDPMKLTACSSGSDYKLIQSRNYKTMAENLHSQSQKVQCLQLFPSSRFLRVFKSGIYAV